MTKKLLTSFWTLVCLFIRKSNISKDRLQLPHNVSAGKTTLMDVLACRKTGGYIEGASEKCRVKSIIHILRLVQEVTFWPYGFGNKEAFTHIEVERGRKHVDMGKEHEQ
ncbi:hypothetical protein MTR_8g106920 [Medicago truncatula]|uniref:Uncharacterized protein n=1 Tax=Medicago truncatula TaxID=3880 RepID=G7LDA8_MEDTR|nr:hypothetical protein MTR_8g106920 [Medicago truncatula]